MERGSLDAASRIDAALLLVTRAAAALGAAAIAGILVLTVAAVVMRYGVGAPFRFSEELAGLLLSASIFLTLPYAVAAHLNIRVTLAAEKLPRAPRRAAWVLGQLILVAFGTIFAVQAWAITDFTWRLGLKSEQARLPLTPWLFLMVVSVAVATAIAAWQALRPPPRGAAPGPGAAV